MLTGSKRRLWSDPKSPIPGNASFVFDPRHPRMPILGTMPLMASRSVNHMRPDHAITSHDRRSIWGFRLASMRVSYWCLGPSAIKVIAGITRWIMSKMSNLRELWRGRDQNRCSAWAILFRFHVRILVWVSGFRREDWASFLHTSMFRSDFHPIFLVFGNTITLRLDWRIVIPDLASEKWYVIPCEHLEVFDHPLTSARTIKWA
jgi:hypothetical protein